MMIQKTKIIIVGGGAGGLELATKLGHKNKFEITLVDCNKSHLWKSLLHEVAGGSLDSSIHAVSYLAHSFNHYFRFQLGFLININRKNKNITLAEIHDNNGKLLVPERQLNFDILVMALGSVSNDYGIVGVKEYCIFLDDANQANRFYDEMLNLFLKYSAQHNQNDKINIAIVGGGATGVELSAEIYNSIEQLRSYGLSGLDSKTLNVTIVEAGDRILPSFPIRISTDIHNKLTKLGVRILTQTIVTNVDANGFNTKSGEKINADLMVWAAGIKAADFMQQIGGLETNRINQLLVKPTLQTTFDSFIFAIGDCAYCPKKNGGFVPPRAQAAHQMANLCYKNIIAFIEHKELKEYVYKDHGSLVSLSRFSTVGFIVGNLMRSDVMIKGKIARIVYILLYRMHQVSLHGYVKTGLIILVDIINRIIRPKLKLD
ncbi:MAG: NAD(P)/FAD-dependent oxidoreductase [Arsenophonus sp.]